MLEYQIFDMNIHELTILDSLHPARLFGQRQQQRLFSGLTPLRLKKETITNQNTLRIHNKFSKSDEKL